MIDQQNNSPLFLIPSEIRRRIYEYCLTFTQDEFADTLRPTHTYLDAVEPHSTPLPGLLFACKRAYAELRSDVHTTAALRVHRPGLLNERRIGFAAHGILQLERLRRIILIVDMDYACWNAWLDFLGAVVNRARELEHLNLDWGPRRVTHYRDWERKEGERKEHVFMQVLDAMTKLQTVWMYGQVPGHWMQRIEQGTNATVRSFPYRWWKESGMD